MATTNVKKLGDKILAAFQSPRKGGNNDMSKIIRSDEYDKLATRAGGGGLNDVKTYVLRELGPSSQEGKAFSKLLSDHQKAKTGGTFAEQFSKALRGTPVKQAAKSATSAKPKGGAAQSYGRKMYKKMSPDQQRALQTATQGKTGSILDAVLDNSDKTDFDNFLTSIDQNNSTNLFGQAAPAPTPTPKQAPVQGGTPNQTQQAGNPPGGQTTPPVEPPEKSKMRKFMDLVNPVGTPLRAVVNTGVVAPTAAAGYRAYVSQPREEAAARQQFYEDAPELQNDAATKMAEALMARYGNTPTDFKVKEPDQTLPPVPPEMQLPVDDPLLFPEDNAVITPPPKKGAKK